MGGDLVHLGSIDHPPIAGQLAAILDCILLLVLHGFAHLRLDKVLADLVNVDLRQLLELLHSAIGKSLLAWFDHDEDVLSDDYCEAVCNLLASGMDPWTTRGRKPAPVSSANRTATIVRRPVIPFN